MALVSFIFPLQSSQLLSSGDRQWEEVSVHPTGRFFAKGKCRQCGRDLLPQIRLLPWRDAQAKKPRGSLCLSRFILPWVKLLCGVSFLALDSESFTICACFL